MGNTNETYKPGLSFMDETVPVYRFILFNISTL